MSFDNSREVRAAGLFLDETDAVKKPEKSSAVQRSKPASEALFDKPLPENLVLSPNGQDYQTKQLPDIQGLNLFHESSFDDTSDLRAEMNMSIRRLQEEARAQVETGAPGTEMKFNRFPVDPETGKAYLPMGGIVYICPVCGRAGLWIPGNHQYCCKSCSAMRRRMTRRARYLMIRGPEPAPRPEPAEVPLEERVKRALSTDELSESEKEKVREMPEKNLDRHLKICVTCGKLFLAFRSNEKYCSDECGSRYIRDRQAVEKTCRYCGKKFMTTDRRIGYCSEECLRQSKREQVRRQVSNSKKSHTPPSKCPVCNRTMKGAEYRGVCSRSCHLIQQAYYLMRRLRLNSSTDWSWVRVILDENKIPYSFTDNQDSDHWPLPPVEKMKRIPIVRLRQLVYGLQEEEQRRREPSSTDA